MIKNWPYDFILYNITNNIICLINLDHYKCKGYTVSLETGNYKNDLQVIQDKAFYINKNNLLIIGFVYTNINKERTDLNV